MPTKEDIVKILCLAHTLLGHETLPSAAQFEVSSKLSSQAKVVAGETGSTGLSGVTGLSGLLLDHCMPAHHDHHILSLFILSANVARNCQARFHINSGFLSWMQA